MKKLTLAALIASFMLVACNKGTEPTTDNTAGTETKPGEATVVQPAQPTTEPQTQVQPGTETPAPEPQTPAVEQQPAAPATPTPTTP